MKYNKELEDLSRGFKKEKEELKKAGEILINIAKELVIEEEKKYYWKLIFKNYGPECDRYFVFCKETYWLLMNKTETNIYKTKFTKEEFEIIRQRFEIPEGIFVPEEIVED